MKVCNSLRSKKNRHKGCQVVRRRGVTRILNKEQPRFKCRQGRPKKKR